jgi:hypothetical protein
MYIKTAYNRSDTVGYGQIRSDTVTAKLRLRNGYGTATVRLRYYGCCQESEGLLYISETIKFPEKVKNGTMEKVENSC